MRRIQKLTQQRRRQLHVHIPPSGIMEVPYRCHPRSATRSGARQSRTVAGRRPGRLKVRPGTKQALLELMEWAGIEEQGEAMTVMIPSPA